MNISYELLQPETLRNLVENFISGETTDYGERECSHETKVAQVMRQLKSGEATIVYDEASDSCYIAAVLKKAVTAQHISDRNGNHLS